MFGFQNTGQIFYLFSYVKELAFQWMQEEAGSFWMH